MNRHDNETHFWQYLNMWLQQNLIGDPENIQTAIELVMTIRDGYTFKNTPFEWAFSVTNDLFAQSYRVSEPAQIERLIAEGGWRLADALEDVLVGGTGLEWAKRFLEESSSSAPEKQEVEKNDSRLEDLDDLDQLFKSKNDNDIQQLVQSLMTDSDWSLPDTSAERMEAVSAPIEIPESQPCGAVAAPGSEDLQEDAVLTSQGDFSEGQPFDTGGTSVEPLDDVSATELSVRNDRIQEGSKNETDEQYGTLSENDAQPCSDPEGTTDTPDASQSLPEVNGVETVVPSSESSGEESETPQDSSTELADTPDTGGAIFDGDDLYAKSRQTIDEILTRIRSEIAVLESHPENEEALGVLHSLVGRLDHPVRRLNHRTFSSLSSAVQQLLESVQESHLPLPQDLFKPFSAFIQTVEDIVTGRASKNKTYYNLITDLMEVQDVIKAAVEEEEERKQLDRMIREKPENETLPGAQAERQSKTAGDGESDEREGKRAKLTDLQEIFLVEATEYLDALTRNLLLIEKEPANQDIIYSLMRAAHSLKGSAAIAKFTNISSVAHSMEDLLVIFRDEVLCMSGEAINILLTGVDLLQAMCVAVESGEEVREEAIAQFNECNRSLAERVLANKEDYRSKGQVEVSVPAPDLSKIQPTVTAASKSEVVKFVRVDIKQLDSLMNLAADMVINRTRLNAQIEQQQATMLTLAEYRRRLRLFGNRLGSLVLSTRNLDYDTVQSSYRTVEIEEGGATSRAHRSVIGSSFSRSGHQILTDFSSGEFDRFSELDLIARDIRDALTVLDDLSDNMIQVSSGMEQNLSQIALVSNDLHQSLMRTRMVPIGQIFNRFPRVVRDLSNALGKQINLHMSGEDTLLDKNIIEEITNPIIHIIRNAVDHGIEQIEERERMEKQKTGNIWLSAKQTGNQILIEITDDGRGINYMQLRQVATSRGILSPEESENASETDLYNLLLLPGFSTAAEVTDLSGRGVGLDVANQAIKHLNGSLHISSEFNEGTTISIRLPITLAINQALLFSVGSETFSIPLSSVDELLSASEAEILFSGGQPIMMLRGQVIPVFNFKEIAELEGEEVPLNQQQIIVISDGLSHGALLVDSLLGREEIVVKSLGNHLKRVRYFSGATILGDGRVTLIVDPAQILMSGESGVSSRSEMLEIALASGTTGSDNQNSHAGQAPQTGGSSSRKEMGSTKQVSSPKRSPQAGSADWSSRGQRGKRRILVTDDSISIRRYVSGILEGAGYEVQTACDGVDALERLSDSPYDLILTDLEMPRMHGYELITEIKGSVQHRNTPIVILTSRMGDKHSRKGLELGASAFMVKPFEQSQLLLTVSQLIESSAS